MIDPGLGQRGFTDLFQSEKTFRLEPRIHLEQGIKETVKYYKDKTTQKK